MSAPSPHRSVMAALADPDDRSASSRARSGTLACSGAPHRQLRHRAGELTRGSLLATVSNTTVAITGPTSSINDPGAHPGCSTSRAWITLNAAPTTPAATNDGKPAPGACSPSRPSSMNPATRSMTSARRSSARGPAPKASTNTTRASAGSRSKLANNTTKAPRTRSTHSSSPTHAGPTAPPELLDRAIEHSEEAVFAVGEQVIKRLRRHPRPRRHTRAPNRRTPSSATTPTAAFNKRSCCTRDRYTPPPRGPGAPRRSGTRPPSAEGRSHRRHPRPAGGSPAASGRRDRGAQDYNPGALE